MVTDSRPARGSVKRRRCCTYGHRFTTYELIGDPKQPADLQIKRAVSMLRQFAAELEAQISEC